jgi:hypothetical protein
MISEEGKKRVLEAAARGRETIAARCKKQFEDVYNNNPKLCKQCGAKIAYDKRNNDFCDHSCASSFNNLGVARNAARETTSRQCLCCGKELTRTQEKYCSLKCQTDLNNNNKRQEIMRSNNLISIGHKHHLIDIRGNTCEICGVSEWNGKPIVLVLDHIDGNSDNWSLDNLQLICPNCDSQTSTYKSRNKGHGRYARRIRYKQGGSY